MHMLRRNTSVLRNVVFALLGGIVLPSAASAKCVWSDLVGNETLAAAVRPGPKRIRFVEDDAVKSGCPKTGPTCQARAFVVPDDVVITGRSENGFICAGFLSDQGKETIGWLPASALAPLGIPPQQQSDWVGEWSGPERDIEIKAGTDGALEVEGEATWGLRNPRKDFSVHTGAVNGTAKPEEGVLAFTEGDQTTLRYDEGADYNCRVRMTLRGPYLVVRDNDNCGGVNVSFSGLYRRKG